MKFLKKLVFLFLGCGFIQISAHAQEYLDNALYVKFKESSSVSAKNFNREVVPIEALNLKINAKKMAGNAFHREARSLSLFDNPILDRTFRIQFDSTENIEKIIRMLEKDPNVEFVERIPIFKTFAETPQPKSAPNDPYYQTIDGVEYLWYLKMIDAEGAWALQKGDSNIIAAVVDGAVWGEHPELQIPSSRQYESYSQTEGNSAPPSSVNQDQLCTTLYSPDPQKDVCPPYSWSHGTHCAGVVGAKNDDGIGIASLASGVTLLGVAAYHPLYSNAVVGGYEGIRWAADHGAKVISCSWGSDGNGGNIGNAILKTCYDNNIVIVAAAGNENTSLKGEPASSMYVISVGSVDESRFKSSFSNYGSWVSIAAPGGSGSRDNKSVGILSTTFCKSQSLRLRGITNFNGEYYDEMSGTSMATPLVASLCALMLSRDSTLTPAEIKDILQNTADYNISNKAYFTPLAGIINAGAAIKAIDEAKFDAPVENLAVTKIHIDTVWLQWDAPIGNEHELKGYRIYRNGIVLDSCTTVTAIIDTLVPGGDMSYMVSALYEDGYMSVRKEARALVPEKYTIRVLTSPSAGGIVEGAGVYVRNDAVRLNATPNPGYIFEGWIHKGKTVSTRQNYSFRATEDAIYTALFQEDVANETASDSEFSISPNPVKDELHLSCISAAGKITVYDLQGKLIMELNGNNNTVFSLNVSELRQGTYILQIQTATGTHQQKFVKL